MMATQRQLTARQRSGFWRDRFGARWHYDSGGWIRTPLRADASRFGLRPDERYGPFFPDNSPSCPIKAANPAGSATTKRK
ncbi:hypothetical protein CJN95_015960 [Mycobacteroides abscessus subsp. abscessus]|nr:hypothetical protein CJN95_015960 [Mycobacteroides abscessus subsp. abscessus]